MNVSDFLNFIVRQSAEKERFLIYSLEKNVLKLYILFQVPITRNTTIGLVSCIVIDKKKRILPDQLNRKKK